jgi:hypothetical protein
MHKAFLILRNSGEMTHLPWNDAKRMLIEERKPYLSTRLKYIKEVTLKLAAGETDEDHSLIPESEPQLCSLLDKTPNRLLPEHESMLRSKLEILGNYSRPILQEVLKENNEYPWPNQQAGNNLKVELYTIKLDNQIDFIIPHSLMYEEYYYRTFSLNGSSDPTIYKDCALTLCNNETGETHVIISDGIFQPDNKFINWLYGIDSADEIVELFESELTCAIELCVEKKLQGVRKQERLDESLGIDHTLSIPLARSCKG